MRAVNLLPSDLRGAAPKPARAGRSEKAEGSGAFVLLGVLALSVLALAGYVLTTNGVKQAEADLEAARQQATAAQARASALQPYADFASLANSRVETVRGLAAARFDWEQALGDLSRAIPGDVKLQSLNGDMGLPGATGAGADPLRGSITAPAMSLAGCAPTQSAVARMMARLKAVDGVTRVSLSKSIKASTSAASGGTASVCSGEDPPSFSVVVFFENDDALAAIAQGGADTSVLVPNAVNTSPTAGTEPAAGATDPAAAGTTPAADPAAAATSTTTPPAIESDAAGTTTTTGTTP